MVDFDELTRRAQACSLAGVTGKIISVDELGLEALLPGARIGHRVEVSSTPGGPVIRAEVARCEGERARLLPLSSTIGIGVGDRVEIIETAGTIPCGDALIGRVIDPFGAPLDGLPQPAGTQPWPLHRPAPDPMSRDAIDEQLVTGLRAIDGCLAIGKGQRIGLFAGPGEGKSTLLATLAKDAAADACVICLVGERGREVREFVDGILGDEGLRRSVVVLASADAPPLVRVQALETATAVAEWFRSKGKHALLLVDSLTRVVRARRDTALALGEAPARAGFPVSSFSSLPLMLERAGRDGVGSITAVYAVLTEGTDDDPVAQEARSLLDGHIVLSAKLAGAGRWPAIDVVKSISRVMGSIVSKEHRLTADTLRRLQGALAENEDLILMGAYKKGSSRDTDTALARKQQIDAFLQQGPDEISTLEQTISALQNLTREA